MSCCSLSTSVRMTCTSTSTAMTAMTTGGILKSGWRFTRRSGGVRLSYAALPPGRKRYTAEKIREAFSHSLSPSSANATKRSDCRHFFGWAQVCEFSCNSELKSPSKSGRVSQFAGLQTFVDQSGLDAELCELINICASQINLP